MLYFQISGSYHSSYPTRCNFQGYATATSAFQLLLPARFSFSVRRGKPKKASPDCCKPECCEISQFRPCQSSRTPREVILTSTAFRKKEKFFHSSSSIRAAQSRASRGEDRLELPAQAGLDVLVPTGVWKPCGPCAGSRRCLDMRTTAAVHHCR